LVVDATGRTHSDRERDDGGEDNVVDRKSKGKLIVVGNAAEVAETGEWCL
jgi:hypothetical protein